MSLLEGDTQLAAIMFTDIAGYSRLMEEDEQRTIRLLDTHNSIVLPLVEAAGGEVIDAIGDGLFILFPSVRDTVTCASSICDAIDAHNQESTPDHQFHLRIGVHLGEIWRRGERVYGNGVNIAARVQPFARPGGICVTEDVYRQVATRPEIHTVSLGRHKLRNISRELELYHILTGYEITETDPERTAGELDEAKERILRERQKITETRSEGGESGTETGIESKIYRLVDRAMDKALEKWEELPSEKKQEALAELRKESGKGPAAPSVEADKKPHSDEKDSSFAPGLVMGLGFGLGYFLFDIGWMIWPFLFAGVLPFAAGLVKSLRSAIIRRRRLRERPSELQHLLLELARRHGGRLTVVQAAASGRMTLDEARRSLERMVRDGYVAKSVGDKGAVYYEFPGILPSRDNSSIL